MPRLLTLLLAAVLVLVPASLTATAGASAPPTAAPAQVDPDTNAADDPADAPGAEQEDAPDRPFTQAELVELCATLADEGPSDDANADEERDPALEDDDALIEIDLGELGAPGDASPAEDTLDPEAEADDPDAVERLCADLDPPDEAADGGTLAVSVKQLLARGALSTGAVRLPGAGTVTQELWLPGRPGAAIARSSGQGGRSARARRNGRLLAGSVKRTVGQAGVVHLSVRLNAAARGRLRTARKDVRLTVRTVMRLKGGKPRTRTGTVVVRRKAVR